MVVMVWVGFITGGYIFNVMGVDEYKHGGAFGHGYGMVCRHGYNRFQVSVMVTSYRVQ
jgi:hypothetical protein